MKQDELIATIRQIVDESHRENSSVVISLLDKHEDGPHHQYIQAEIKKEARRQEMWERLKGNLIFWILTGVTATIGLALWNHYVDKQ